MSNIPAWSFSRLKIFEACKLRAELAFVQKIPEPDRPLPPGKSEHANDRGTRIHTGAEKFVQGGVELIPELSKFQFEFLRLRELHKQGKVSVEGEWAVDINWAPVAWMSSTAWARIKLDVFVRINKEHGVIIDYKTGRRFGNEVTHAEQCQLYALAAFMRYPELQTLDVELWYTDVDELVHTFYLRDTGLRFFQGFHRRGLTMTSAQTFPPNPNIHSCKYCPYGPRGTGHCTKGV